MRGRNAQLHQGGRKKKKASSNLGGRCDRKEGGGVID